MFFFHDLNSNSFLKTLLTPTTALLWFNFADRLPLYAPHYIAVNFSKGVDDDPTLDDLNLPPAYSTDGQWVQPRRLLWIITGQANHASSRFSSAIFQVSTGAGQVEYAVDETCLRNSPVFAKMCDPGFKEALEKRITSPAERPSHLRAIVEYLYTDDFWTRGNPQDNSSTTSRALELAHLYVSATQYGLEAMKDIIVAKLRLCHQSNEFSDWLEAAEII